MHVRHVFEAPHLLLQSATVNTFANNKYVMIVSERYAMSVVNSGNSEFYVFGLACQDRGGFARRFWHCCSNEVFLVCLNCSITCANY